MSSVSEFFSGHMAFAFFVNGLAFFTMGLAITLAVQKPGHLVLEGSLWLLAAHAFLRASGNWMEMFRIIEISAASSEVDLFLTLLNPILLVLAGLCLLQFGIRSIVAVGRKHVWLRWLSPGLASVWVLVSIYSIYSSPGRIAEALTAADVWGRYLVYCPGSLLSATALFIHARIIREMKFANIAGHCAGAGVSFGLKAVFAGLVVPEAPVWAASFFNETSFFALTGVPVQVFRVLSNLAITYFMVQTVRIFAIRRNVEIESATQQRFQAQQEALEAQRRAHEDIERWSRQLGNVVRAIAIAISDELSRLDARSSEKGHAEPSLSGEAEGRQEARPKQHFELEKMLDVALHQVLEFTGFESGNAFIVNEDGKNVSLVATHDPEGFLKDAETTMCMGKWPGNDAEPGGFIVLDQESRPSEAPACPSGRRPPIRASLLLKFKNRVQGVMNLASKNHHVPTAQEMTLLAAIGQQLGVAIQSVRLYDRMQNVAILEERDRIARELHDGLAQVLGYMHMKSKALQSLLSSCEAGKMLAELREMQDVSRDAYRDVRESILGLRTTITRDRGLIPTLREYLFSFSRQSGVRADLVVRSDVRMEFEPHAEIQLLRIVQEALTNVRKHSQASRAWVRLEAEPDHQVVVIEDNGRGFGPLRIGRDQRQRFGLQTMTERAEGAGGSLQILAQPGQGTKVIVHIPLNHHRSE